MRAENLSAGRDRLVRASTAVGIATVIFSVGVPGAAASSGRDRADAETRRAARHLDQVAQRQANYGGSTFREQTGVSVIATVGDPSRRLRTAVRSAQRSSDLRVRLREARYTRDRLDREAGVAEADRRVIFADPATFGGHLAVTVPHGSELLGLGSGELREELNLTVRARAYEVNDQPDATS